MHKTPADVPTIIAPQRRITIGMVTYNAAATLEKSLASVVRFRSPALELVVMDGGSTDGTVDILQRHDSDIDHWQSAPDRNIYDAMNKVLQVASGDWLLFLGADDLLLADPAVLLASMWDVDALYHGNVRIAGRHDVWGGRYSQYRLMQENICHQAVLYPRAVYRSKRYDIDCGILADHRYNIEVKGSGVRFVHLDQVVSCFNAAGRSSAGDPAFERVKLDAIRNSFGLHWYLVKRLRNLAVRLFKHWLKPGHGAA